MKSRYEASDDRVRQWSWRRAYDVRSDLAAEHFIHDDHDCGGGAGRYGEWWVEGNWWMESLRRVVLEVWSEGSG
jgi:hypothetical protein